MTVQQQRRLWVMVETSLGNVIVTELRSNGKVSWEVNPSDLSERLATARELRSTDCIERNVTVGEMMWPWAAAEDDAQLRMEHYAQEVYSLTSGENWMDPPGAVSKASADISQECGRSIEFSLDRFRHFDASAMQVDPVEPVDSHFGRYGGRCLLLRNVITKEECEYLIQHMSEDMETVRYRQDYRSNDRCIFESPELASILWSRVEPVARELSICVGADGASQHLLKQEAGSCPEELQVGYGSVGVWHPTGLNECLRFCRYNAGGFFRAHCDASFRRSRDEKSLFTCMFYLNGDLDGGATRFLRVDTPLNPDNQYKVAEEHQVLASIPPEAGSCLLFLQPGLLHEGEDLRSGTKYILRSDVMFRRDPKSVAAQLSPQQLEAMRVLEQAQIAEERREFTQSIALYKRAFSLDPRLERMV
jgi:hypothetical protein